MPLLVVEDLTVRFEVAGQHLIAVDGVGFELDVGERVALIGESGSGKTAACLAIAGFLTQPNVSIEVRRLEFEGMELTHRSRSRLPESTSGLAMVFQDAMTSLDPVWTVGSQLRAVLRASGHCSKKESNEQAREWLGLVGLHETERIIRSRPYELSGGMRQRVMLALALCGRPRLLIADEPTSALDAALARDAMELLLRLTEQFGTTVLIVSHDVRLAQEYCDRTFVMYGGRIVERGSSDTIVDAPMHPYTEGLLRSVPTLESAGLDELPTIASQAGVGQFDPEGGCSFRPRCPRAGELCGTPPSSAQVGNGHQVRCWYAGRSPVRAESA